MKVDEAQQRRLAVTIVEATPLEHRPALMLWAQRLRDIAASDLSKVRKAKEALAATKESRLIWPIIKTAAARLKQMGWVDRSPKAKVFMVTAAVSATLFGGKAAGIAALGTAIGVPLWVVFGAGAAFATGIVEEIRRKSRSTGASSGATYTVIDADEVSTPRKNE